MTAEEMFEQIGFKTEHETKYKYNDLSISFNKETKYVEIRTVRKSYASYWDFSHDSLETKCLCLRPDALQAIVEQCKELGWQMNKEDYKQITDRIIRENKTRRVQLLMKPSLHETTKQKAQSLGLSFNDYVSMVLEEANSKE